MAPKNKTKSKSKSKGHKASLGKIANKKTNRLAKQGKLNKVDKKKKKRRAHQEELNQKQQNEMLAAASVPEEESDRESESSEEDEDLEYFQHLQNAQDFARVNLASESSGPERGKKRKRNEEDEIEDYEQKPRSFQDHSEAKDMKMMLPIISKGKVIKRMVPKEQEGEIAANEAENESEAEDNTEEAEKSEEEEEEDQDKEQDEQSFFESLTTAQQFAYRKRKLAEKKQKIAVLSNDILEDPQNNMKKLKELRFMLGEQSPGVSLTVRKYAMVSLMEIFKDIVPGYRLRIPTEKERTQRVKKETKSLWDYEASFLLNYKIYIQFLEIMAKGKPIPDKSFLTKHGINHLQLPKASVADMSQLALKCLCQMLVNHPHFNYCSDVIAAIVPFTNHDDMEMSDIACNAVRKIFKQDKQGNITLEIVRTIGRMVKKLQFDVQPKVLETFLDLKIKEVDLSGLAETNNKMKRKEKFMKYSRRERKRLKQKEQLDKELLETKATADKQQRLKLHTEIIQAVFETYIRVIKLASDSIVLPAVLEGLAKFAHLINIEYFDSLFNALNSLIESQILSTKEILHCIQTAFVILSGQGSVINIDPSGFYKHFYGALLAIHAGRTSDSAPVAIDCLDSLINKRKKQVSQHRILAFMKRLATMCLQQTPEAAIGFLAAIRQFVHTYKYSDLLFDEDVQGSGIYLPYLDDPEHCCANNTSLWELHLLKRHYDPDVQTYTKHVIKQAPLTGENQLPKTLARKSPRDLFEYLSGKGVLDNIPEHTPKKKRIRASFCNREFEEKLQSIYHSEPSISDGEMAREAKLVDQDVEHMDSS